MSSREREAHHNSTVNNLTTDINNLKKYFETKLADTNLKLQEFENESSNQLEMEELNQQTFDHLRVNINDVHGKAADDVAKLKTSVSRAVDSLTMALHDVKRQSEEDRLTQQKRVDLRNEIERDVMQSVTTVMQNQLSREIENVKLVVKTELLQREKSEVLQVSNEASEQIMTREMLTTSGRISGAGRGRVLKSLRFSSLREIKQTISLISHLAISPLARCCRRRRFKI